MIEKEDIKPVTIALIVVFVLPFLLSLNSSETSEQQQERVNVTTTK